MKSRNKFRLAAIVAAIALVFAVPLITNDPYYLHVLIGIIYYIVLAWSIRLIMLCGQVSFAHASFMAIGAYGSALLTMRLGLSTWLAMPLGAIIAGLVAILIGIPALRLKGAYFFLATFAFAEVIIIVFGGYFTDLFGAKTGITGIPSPNPIGSIQIVSKSAYYWLVSIIALLTGLFFWRVDKSRIGLILRSIAQADNLAESVGMNLVKYKIMASAIGSGIAGLVGGFYAHYVHVVTPDAFSVWKSLQIVAFVVVGGVANLGGPIIGVLLLTVIAVLVRDYIGPYETIVYAIALVLFQLVLPDGLLGLPKAFSSFRAKLRKTERRVSPTDSVT